MTKEIAKYVVEIRFTPDPRILDKRGEIAENISNNFLEEWKISSNKIEFTSKENESALAYFSYKNFALVSDYPNDKNFFLDKSEQLIKSSWQYFPTNKIIRLGVRSTFFIKTDSFKKTFESYKDSFLKIEDNKLKEIGELVDMGFPLNFIVDNDHIHTTTGPMEKEQAKQSFGEIEEIPESGIFLDVDYFRKDFSSYIKQKDVLDFVKKAVDKSDDIKNTILNILKQ